MKVAVELSLSFMQYGMDQACNIRSFLPFSGSGYILVLNQPAFWDMSRASYLLLSGTCKVGAKVGTRP